MELDCARLKESLLRISSLRSEDNSLTNFLKLNNYEEKDVDDIVYWLAQKILDSQFTESIAVCFPEILMAIVALAVPIKDETDWHVYLKKCIALSKLNRISPEVARYSVIYFSDKDPPFHKENFDKVLKRHRCIDESVTDLDIMKCCFDLLINNRLFYKDLWDWSIFVEKYSRTSDEIQRMYFNQIMAVLFNMTEYQLKQINRTIPEDVVLNFYFDFDRRVEVPNVSETANCPSKYIYWNFSSEIMTSIEGVLLPMYNIENAAFYNKLDPSFNKIVRVKSTKVNLKNIAMGLSVGKAICLFGPVGCGKTSLVEYLARKTGRIPPNIKVKICSETENEQNVKILSKFGSRKAEKRKIDAVTTSHVMVKPNRRQENGLLRIQLGDQTDSKILLGQYRCTDVPGEFVWQPGVLTQAVMNGHWLLLEDFDLAPQEAFTIISNLLENNCLAVPGFCDSLYVTPGFQLFLTVRSQKSLTNTQKTMFSLLEKYLYIVNVKALSRSELCHIVSANYPKLLPIANRIVDVFLMFCNDEDHEVSEDSMDCKSSDLSLLQNAKDSSPRIVTFSRLVSTRDLMKLCERSHATFSEISTEYAYFVFQNVVDLFCSHLSEDATKLELIINIGAKLGITQSRCEYLFNQFKPDIDDQNASIKIGRAYLYRKESVNLVMQKRGSDTNESIDVVAAKKSKLNDDNVYLPIRRKEKITFSYTRLACSLLERISVCINHAEPVLLVGETGVGKTSCIQYLADKTNHKLVVVNMNNQSDVSDLIGGFKPVDLSSVIAPIRHEFELLFRKTFNENKNEKFLSNFSACFNRGDFRVLVKLMLKISETVFKGSNIPIINKRVGEWKELQKKIIKLNLQLSKSANVSFAFIIGPLVKCIKNGDWILLDEINLASDETLQCLSTLLEENGSILLLEKGDLVPVERHPEFRLFACMNPGTDVGKKDLPTSIRNRFTELFADELTNEMDLRILIGDYLQNTGINSIKISAIVKLYKKLMSLSQIELNDGLGNRPIFSLRTLCRALTICARNLCGSVERNLYESFCLSFLTQLDHDSHKIVLDLIKASLLSNYKAVISQEIPRPGEHYLNFEGYWIEKGSLEVENCTEYILTETVRENLKDVARIISIGKYPILLQGPTSAGKTSLVEYIAKKSGNHCFRINNHEHTDLQEYIGTYIPNNEGQFIFEEGILVQAMRKGYWIILDELNLASTDILEALNRVLDDNREIFIPETQTVVKAHPKFMLFATQNPPGLYGGRKVLSRAFKNRFIELHFSEIPRPELEVILEKRCKIPKSFSEKMVKCMSELQINRKTTMKNNFTLRDLFRWGNRYTWADRKLLRNNSYDWNQHLVDEGYLILSAKVRTETDNNMIVQTLFNNFRKKIDLNNLFSLHRNTSLVTKDILELLFHYDKRSDIIWTQSMLRIAVLIIKALHFNEPVLLVGPTGCGKTTICQMLADINNSKLRILNCHMHTEGADFLGGLRPCRVKEKLEISKNNVGCKTQMFEWVDGPLIQAMRDGSFFMVDEISLAEDSVLERLNSVLEPSRSIVLAEKGGTITKTSDEFIVKAAPGFHFLATMNPGGDFGKKELSPALRNRCTEIWCQPSDTEDDLIKIASNSLKIGLNENIPKNVDEIARVMVRTVYYLKGKVDKFNFSVRDILAWANFINTNSNKTPVKFAEFIIYGLNTVFLDSLEMLLHESENSTKCIRNDVIKFAAIQLQNCFELSINILDIVERKDLFIEKKNDKFGIEPFFVDICTENLEVTNFQFNAPTTKKNLFRLLSALSLNKAVMLEGPPGVGKTSIVENLARAVGYRIVRINLCEHTDLADLFGSDLPAGENISEVIFSKNKSELNSVGSFQWCDGPLLSALKSKFTWILLDELNLAPQSVLEGLNAILDHRGEVFIPELNQTFTIENQTKIFACQNPSRQGGGRKGLPQSFLNRFTKVYLSKLHTQDLLYVINNKYFASSKEMQSKFTFFLNKLDIKKKSVNLFDINNLSSSFEILETPNNVKIEFDLLYRMVKFSERLNEAISNFDFGTQGGPFEANLRDLLRWCEFLFDSKTGFIFPVKTLNKENHLQQFKEIFHEFLLVLYERMKLVYYQRMESKSDRLFIQTVFSEIFKCDVKKLNSLSDDVSIYWTDSELFLNDIVLSRLHDYSNSVDLTLTKDVKPGAIVLSCQVELLKNIVECVHLEKAVILSGPAHSGKTKIIDTLCSAANTPYYTEIIDDSVAGSFQQIDLIRHFEEVAFTVEAIYFKIVHGIMIDIAINNSNSHEYLIQIMKLWSNYSRLSRANLYEKKQLEVPAGWLVVFHKRIHYLRSFVDKVKFSVIDMNTVRALEEAGTMLNTLEYIVKETGTLNTAGHFEWIDSKIIKCLKFGGYICLDHANFCSSAILDRLNPILEPEGSLLLSEKGSLKSGNSEVADKHRNFRIFFTINPRNGSLSRAMRNRCVELNFLNNKYSEDDLRQIVYLSGVKENYLILTAVQIHHKFRNISEEDIFNISHLSHFADLIVCNKHIGLNERKAVYNSAMEVYIYSVTADPVGCGLEIYKNKLQEILVEECQKIKPKPNICNINNVILRPKEMNQMTMLKMQAEPLVGLLKCYPNKIAMSEAIGEIFSKSVSIDFENPFLFIKCYVCMLYLLSNMSDFKLRCDYITQIIQRYFANKSQGNDENRILLALNSTLFHTIERSKDLFGTTRLTLPWNTKLFPRIRSYNCLISKTNEELILNAQLFANLLMDSIKEEQITKLSNITAICYSQAVASKQTFDRFNNVFLEQLWPFITKVECQVYFSLQHDVNLTMDDYPDLILSLLWFNRFYNCVNNNIIIDKNLNQNLLDKIYLHFKWLKKKLLSRIFKIAPKNKIDELEVIMLTIEQYSPSNLHSLRKIQKIFSRELINFFPHFSIEQVDLYNYYCRIRNLTELAPKFGNYDVKDIRSFASCINSTELDIGRLFLDKNIELLNYLNKIGNSHLDIKTDLPENVKLAIRTYFDNAININETTTNSSTTYQLLTKIEQVFHLSVEMSNLHTTTLDINAGLLPLKDYFATRALSLAVHCEKTVFLNDKYFNKKCASAFSSQELLQVVRNDSFQKFKIMWQTVLSYIFDIKNPVYFESLLSSLSLPYYRNFSTFNRILLKMLQYHRLTTLSSRPDVINYMEHSTNIPPKTNYTGPALISCLIPVLFDELGELKSVELNNLVAWRMILNDMRQMIWYNSILMCPRFDAEKQHFHAILKHSKKIILEVEYIQKKLKNVECIESDQSLQSFQDLLDVLRHIQNSAERLNIEQFASYDVIQQQSIYVALLESIVGSIELCLYTYLPTVDPVEKKRLKNSYRKEEADFLKTLLSAYDLLRIVMRYNGLACEEYEHFKRHLIKVMGDFNKNTQRVAIRPEVCKYHQLVEDIRHFLDISCKPEALLKLLRDAIDCLNSQTAKNDNITNDLKVKSLEVTKKLDIWILNSERFRFNTKKSYGAYYKDFIEPLECCLVMTQSGFQSLKFILIQHQRMNCESSSTPNINPPEKFNDILQETFQFPFVRQTVLHCNISQRLQELQSLIIYNGNADLERSYFKVLKAKLLEIKNYICIAGTIEQNSFNELELIFKICNKIWKKEEEKRLEKEAEENNLYVNKILCQNENLEESEIEEIETYFPTNIQEDFAEFTVEGSSKQKKSVGTSKKCMDILNPDECNFLARIFICIMEHFSSTPYYKGKNMVYEEGIDYVTPFKTKLPVFFLLLQKHNQYLNSNLDNIMYNTYGFMIALQQETLGDIPLSVGSKSSYNFYKDSNIPEVSACVEIISKVVDRTKEQLLLYSDHAVLMDILRIVEKIQSFPSTSPVARFNVGFQILREKLSQWNEVAHRKNNFRDLEEQVAVCIQKWTKLELQCWRNCLQQSFDNIKNGAYKYWFYIYNLLHEYLESKDGEDCSKDIIQTIQQFVQNSNYADFSVRMRLLKSFEMYLHYMNGTNTTRKSNLIAILRNIQIYFCQFNQEVDEAVKAFRLPIEKKLREYVKIESYNKDLSYFALKSNISRMHRHINKFLREFENCLKGKITPVFQYKDNTFKDYDFHNDKGVNLRHEPKHKYYMLDAKNFLVPLKLKNSFKDMLPNIKDSSLLAKRNKLFAASRTIVQESIKNSQYATMVHSLDSLLSNQIETCEYLRKLEVDRTQEKSKQKSQAKYILSQKKKSLSDLYKTLTTIGVNFKSGLLELSLNSEFMNFHIEPFCVKTMFIASKTRKLDQNLIYLSNNLDLYYAKCVFKVKILQRVMLTPNPELDVVNVDRMKGFSIDLFLLVQSQRKLLSAFSQDLLELRRKIADINSLAYCAKYDKFSKDKFCFRKLETDFSSLKYSFCEVQSLIEQYSLLFRCLPQFERNENVALHGFIEEQTLKHYAGDHSKILEKLGKISSSVKEILYEMNTKREIEFLSAQFLEILHKRYGEIIDAIVQVRNDINGPNEEYLPIVKPLNAFLDRSNDREVENYWKWDEQLFQNVGNEIESLIHLVLLSLQKIYKKYIGLKNDLGNPDSIQDDICIMKNHLKEGVYQRFISDIEGLRLPETNRKLSNILFSIKYVDDIDMKVVFTNQIASILPILEQFTSLCDFFLLQQMGAHKVSTKMLSIILTVFIELGTKGFCIPPDMISDESKGSEQQDSNPSQGFGLEDGIGENDVSNRLESEDQLDDAKKPQDSDDNENIDNADCKEEKGIEISDDFNANLQDVENHGEENDKNENEINKDEYDKQMEETDCGVDKLDDQIWGSADESEVEDEMDEELEGGARNEVDKQNDNLGQADDQAPTDEKEATDGLDAVNEKALSTTNNRKQNDMELPNESEEMDEEHTNPHHRNLDDPMEPDELELGDCDIDDLSNKDEEERQIENPFEIDQIKDSMDSGKEERNAESGPDDNEIQNSGSIADDTDSEPEHEFDLAGESHEDLQNSDQEENNEECHSENNPADNENDKIDYNLESTNSANDSSKFEEERNCSENNAYNSREKDDRLRNDKVSDANDVENDTSGDLNDVEKDRNTSGQSKTDVPENGHLSISDSVRVSADSNQEICDEEVTKRNFDEEKTLGEETGDQVKRLRTVEQLKSTEEESTEQTTKEFEPSHEYQHVNEANETDVSTLDNATEDQSKQIEHKEDEKKSGEEENYNKDQSKVANNEDKDRAKNDLSDRRAEKHKQNLKKSCEKLEKIKQLCETIEKVEMEGEPAATYLILREDSTTAYCKQHVVRDITPQESSSIEENEFRKMYQQDFSSTKTIVPQDEDYETWQSISNKMSSNAHEFCEQLRLILEPTKCTRLKGDYRTGRRLNMRKIIPYIASQFRKDKIWLRRTKPSQRDYKITIAIDDSKSMHHNSSKRLTLEAIALVSEALTVLEIGKLSIISFGESPRVLLYHTEQFDGPKLVCGLGFTQNQSKIADLIDFVRNLTIEEGVNCDTKMFENLLLIISDGRNIYSEGEQRVKHAIKLARLQRIFLVYVIIDNPENKHSILDIRMPHFSTDRKSITMASYLDSFPFPFYVIVRDLQKLPFVLSEAMRQWFELVNSDR